LREVLETRKVNLGGKKELMISAFTAMLQQQQQQQEKQFRVKVMDESLVQGANRPFISKNTVVCSTISSLAHHSARPFSLGF